MISISDAQVIRQPSAYHRDLAELSSDPVVSSSQSGNAGDPGAFVPEDCTEGSNDRYDVSAVLWATKWSDYMENEFQRLVALRAERRAKADDLKRLDRFRSLRQRLKNPISAEQLLFDSKAKDLRQTALAAIEAYVHFIQKPAHSKKTRP